MMGPEEKKREEENEASTEGEKSVEGSAESDREKDRERPGEQGERKDTDEIPEDMELPQASFTSLIMMLSTTALGYLSEIEKAEPEKKTILVKLARHTIDMIQVLDEKTKGNLEKDEQELVNRVLTDLRLQAIKFAG